MTGRILGVLAALGLALGGMAALGAHGVRAAGLTYNVGTQSDLTPVSGGGTGLCAPGVPAALNPQCSLRTAISQATDGDTIVLPAGPVNLDASKPGLVIQQAITLQGTDATSTVQGPSGYPHRTLTVDDSTTGAVITIRSVTLDTGNLNSQSGTNDGAVLLGAGGDLVLDHVTLAHGTLDTTDNTGEHGGCLAIRGGPKLTATALTVHDCTVINDGTATVAGGCISLQGAGPNTINGLVVHDCTADGEGGGVFNESGLTMTDAAIIHATGTSGGGLYNEPIGRATSFIRLDVEDAHAMASLSVVAQVGGGGIYDRTVAHQDDAPRPPTVLAPEGTTYVDVIARNDTAVANGGGIYVNPSRHAALSFDRVELSGDGAEGAGGGFYSMDNGNVTLSNTTATGNSAALGGGVATAAVATTGTLALVNDTISANNVDADPNTFAPTRQVTAQTFGGGIETGFGAMVSLLNTIVSNNHNAVGGVIDDCDSTGSNAQGTALTDLGHNLAGADCKLAGTADITSDTPGLDPLGANGGFSKTMAVQATSPALDTASDAGCPALDQRQVTRPQGPHCDIGAYERKVVPPPSSPSSGGQQPLVTAPSTGAGVGGAPLAVAALLVTGGGAAVALAQRPRRRGHRPAP